MHILQSLIMHATSVPPPPSCSFDTENKGGHLPAKLKVKHMYWPYSMLTRGQNAPRLLAPLAGVI